VAFCYAVALHAVLAAYFTALTVIAAPEPAVSFLICHNTADGSSDSDDPTPVAVPCVLCAIVASNVGLPPAVTTDVVVPLVLAGRIQIDDFTFGFEQPPARTGLARAPPYFA